MTDPWQQLLAWVNSEFNWLSRSIGQRFRYLREKRLAIEGRKVDRLRLSRARVPEARP